MKWSISKKITAGFGVCCALIIVCGATGYSGMNRMSEILGFITKEAWTTADGAMEGIIEIKGQIIAADGLRRGYETEQNREALSKAGQLANQAFQEVKEAGLLDQARMDELETTLKSYNNHLSTWSEANEAYLDIKERLGKHSQDFIIFSNMIEAIGDAVVEGLENEPDKQLSWNEGIAKKWAAADGGMESLIGLQQQLYFLQRMETGGNLEECEAQLFMASMIQEEAANRMIESGAFNMTYESDDGDTTYASQYQKFHKHQAELVKDYLEKYKTFHAINLVYNEETGKLLDLLTIIDQEASAEIETQLAGVEGVIQKSNMALMLGVGSCMMLSLIGGIWIVKSTVGPLKTVIEVLCETGNSVASGSTQVADSSKRLAGSANNQAASLEETSASLEEITSVAKRNTDSTEQANSLAKETHEAAEAGSKDMHALETAIEEIRSSSAEVEEIVKDIDEIAFQTNILALNAAVEAARAGEAGAGFAVVADEVRGLAQRCAESAKQTSERIDTAIVRSERGVEIGKRVSTVFDNIRELTRKVDDLVSEIRVASSEQSRGVDHINQAVSEMDEGTQRSAHNAREIDGAASYLHAQAEKVKQSVQELRMVVEGGKADMVDEDASEETDDLGLSDHDDSEFHFEQENEFESPKNGKPRELVDTTF